MSKILIVDDRLLNRQLLIKLLGSHHHLAWEASDGAEALQLARLERPDLVISDVLMPTMDGYEFVRQLRADPIIGQTPVIFITGNYLGREARALAESCGVSSILYRPCNQEEVLRSVNTALESAKHPETVLPLKREEFDREHLQLLTDTLSEKSNQLSAVNLKLTALIELSQKLASEHDPLKLINEYSRMAREIIGAKWNALGMLSKDSQTLQHFHTTGLDDEIAKRLNPPSLDGMFGKLIKDSSPYRIRILDGDPQAEGWPSDFPPLASCLGLPIIFQERIYGWLCLANKLGADEFSDEDEQLAVTLVAQMAAAYENATLYSEARHHAVELEREIAQRKKAEESLHKSEVRYRRLFEAARDGILILNAVTLKIVDVNPYMIELLGYSRDQFLGKELWEIGFFSDKEASQNAFRVLQESGYLRYEDLPLQTVDGKLREVEFVSNVYEENCRQVIQCNIRDITERKLAEESRDSLAAIVESSDDAIISKTFEGVVTSWNASAERMYGYTAAEAIGQQISFITPLEYTNELATILVILQRGGRIKHLETARVRKDGSKIDVSISISPIISVGGRLLGASTIARDITERKEAEVESRESEIRLQTIVESLTEGLAVSDLEGQLLHFNRAALEIHDFTSMEECHHHLTEYHNTFELSDMDGKVLPLEQWPLSRILRGEVLRNLEVRIRRLRGDWQRVFNYGGTLVYDTCRQPMMAVITINDITERKGAENALRARNEELSAMTQQFWQASKLATMGELAASIAHELNNPLATVSLRTESLLGQLPDGDPKRRVLKIIEQEVERMGNLVGNLLQFSRRTHQQIFTVDVYKELENTLDFIEHYLQNRQINIVREFADDLPTLHADRQQLRQVFLNLLVNASDAMTQGGSLTLRVAAGRTEHGASAIVLEFADTGTGIKPEDLLKVWEPFFTTKDEGKGTGLGLAICRRIVEEHKGTINIESEVGQGTTVRITLPASERVEHETRSL